MVFWLGRYSDCTIGRHLVSRSTRERHARTSASGDGRLYRRYPGAHRSTAQAYALNATSLAAIAKRGATTWPDDLTASHRRTSNALRGTAARVCTVAADFPGPSGRHPSTRAPAQHQSLTNVEPFVKGDEQVGAALASEIGVDLAPFVVMDSKKTNPSANVPEQESDEPLGDRGRGDRTWAPESGEQGISNRPGDTGTPDHVEHGGEVHADTPDKWSEDDEARQERGTGTPGRG